MNETTVLSKSGSSFLPADKLPSRIKEMPPVVNIAIIRAVVKTLFREVGIFSGSWILLRTVTWDYLFRRPGWRPEHFNLKDENEKNLYKKIFKEMLLLIIIFNILKEKYGEFLADEITAKMAIPVALPYLAVIFKPGTKIRTIDDIRQLTADYLGSGLGFEWTEEVSEDKTEVRYCFKKCPYISILKAYGLDSFAGYSCLADHVIMDNAMTDIVFGSNHTIAMGDEYCDHMFRLRTPEDREKDESNYGDCCKVRYGGRDEVRHWEEVYKNSGGRFKL